MGNDAARLNTDNLVQVATTVTGRSRFAYFSVAADPKTIGRTQVRYLILEFT